MKEKKWENKKNNKNEKQIIPKKLKKEGEKKRTKRKMEKE